MSNSEPVSSPSAWRSRRELAGKLSFTALAYFLAHQLSFLFPDTTRVLMAIWPAGGVGLAALLLGPRRRWPAILLTLFIAGYSADLLAGRPAVASLGFMAANLVESLCCAWCITKWCGEGLRFRRIKEISALVVAATVLNACTACLGAGAAELTHAATFFNFWLAWWISDGLGILLVTPLIVTVLKSRRPDWSVDQKVGVEWLLFMVLWLAASWLTFEPRLIRVPPHPYMLLAMLAWPALRLGQRAVALAMISLAIIAISSQTVTIGPSIWGGDTSVARLLNIQMFLGFAATVGYFLAASFAETRTLMESLSQSEERFRAITTSSPNHVIVQDRELRYTFVLNPQLGLTEKEMVGKTDRDLLAKEDADQLTALKQKVLEDGTPMHVQVPLLSKDGSTEHFDGAYVPQRASDGTVVGLIGYLRNVTEAKRLERALRDSENSYRTLVQQASEAIFIADQKGKYIDVNVRACALLGYSREELLRLSLADVILPDDLAAHPVDYSAMAYGKPIAVERRLRRKDGTVFFAEISGTMLTDRRYQAIVRDISERWRMQETLRQSEEKYRSLFNNAEVGMFRSRLDGSEILDLNERYAEMLGGKREELLGRSSAIHWIDPVQRAAMVEKLKAVGRITDFECRIRTRDGRSITCLTSIRLYPDQGILEGSIIDITERKRAEAERLHLEQQLSQTQRLESLGQLAGGIAHDFNNLMGAIYGYIELALDGSLDQEATANLSCAMASMSRARELTRQLLTFAKGGAPMRAVGRLFPFVEESARFALSGGRVHCGFDVAPELWPSNFDKNQLGQVMSNLMINAQQAMPDGGAIRISARNVRLGNHEATTLPPGDYVLISVKDHGVGIPAEALPRIFDPFFTTKEQGRGLGLSTCHSIMQRHDGAITVESTPGQGSTFHLYLPAARSSDGLPAEVKPVLRHRGSGRVLVMDDERGIRDVLSAMLTSLGYSAETVVDGKVAVRVFSDAYMAGRPFSAAILDLTVPGGMGGSEAALALRAMDSDVALFVTSGYAEDPVMAKPTDFGFNASLRKPFEKSELSELLEKYCKRKDNLSA